MRILFVSQWYLPEPQELLAEMLESLQGRGHEVTMLTGFPNFPTGKLYPGYRIRLWQREVINGVRIIRVPLFPDHTRSALRRILNVASFVLAATLVGPFIAPRVDLVHVAQPLPAAVPGWILSLLFRVPFTYEIQDMWPETLRATGLVKNACLLRWIGNFAKLIYRHSSAVRVISPGFRNNLLAKGVPSDKIVEIPNWVDTERFRPVHPDAELAQQLGLYGRFNVMFAGVMGPAQGLEVVIDAAKHLQDVPDVQFVLVGDGDDCERLQRAAQGCGLRNVRFLGRFSSSRMNGLYALADVLFVHLRNDSLFRITVPHKVYTYMASAKPILAAAEGDLADLVQGIGAGVTCPPGNAQALADTIRSLRYLPASTRSAMGERGHRAASEEFSRSYLVSRMERMFQSVLCRPLVHEPTSLNGTRDAKRDCAAPPRREDDSL